MSVQRIALKLEAMMVRNIAITYPITKYNDKRVNMVIIT